MAPKSGRETREQLTEAARKPIKKVEEFTSRRRGEAQHVPKAIAEASEAAKDAFVRSMNDAHLFS
jgi:hypothetical protein